MSELKENTTIRLTKSKRKLKLDMFSMQIRPTCQKNVKQKTTLIDRATKKKKQTFLGLRKV